MNLAAMPRFPEGEPRFVSLLKQHIPFMPHWEAGLRAAAGEVDVRSGLTFAMDFPDPEKLLETAVFDFRRFLSEAGIGEGGIPVKVEHIPGFSLESYRLSVENNGIILEASDTEGIRRGLYYLRDLIASKPCLKTGSVRKTPWLKNRISRCFFGPIKRPPFNIDELMNDIDYYPEEYLSELAHEGINGLWLTVEFRELCSTSFYQAPPEAARRIAKLRKTVEQCRRYGIRTFLFCIEPIAWSSKNPLPEGCEELLGPGIAAVDDGNRLRSFCPNSPKAQQFLYECTNSVFKAVPHLGGLFTISYGERMTTCINCIADLENGTIPCPKRCKHTPGEILAMTLEPLKRGMTDANPDAELISWLYLSQPAQFGHWLSDLPEKLSEDMILVTNFESGVKVSQFGHIRVGGDYWLSIVGPSERFISLAQAAKGHCQFGAKLQVANSHECATAPNIPVPGMLYRKYRKMKELGVKHVIQCWFFGNYPGIMNEAAGKLAFEDFSGTEDDFLLRLAAPAWGCDAPKVVQAWKYFTSGYCNYPAETNFQYYGPMHDGTVWPLHLRQTRTPLAPAWKPADYPSGDSIGECLIDFRLEEVTELCGKMSSEWHKGLEVLNRIGRTGHEWDFSLAEALDIMFRSGYNDLRFYLIRNHLMDSPPDSAILLHELKVIAEEEIHNSRRLAELCRKDPRLGYHSEAEVYKYFPEKLEWRARCLEEMLAEDHAAAEAFLKSGDRIGDFIRLKETPATAGNRYGANGIAWSFRYDANEIRFTIDLEKNYPCREEVILLFSDNKVERRPIEAFIIPKQNELSQAELKDCKVYRYDNTLGRNPESDFCPAQQTATASGWRIEFTLKREELAYASEFYFGIQREIYGPDGTKVYHAVNRTDIVRGRLALWRFEPRKLVPVRL